VTAVISGSVLPGITFADDGKLLSKKMILPACAITGFVFLTPVHHQTTLSADYFPALFLDRGYVATVVLIYLWLYAVALIVASRSPFGAI
jgi:hypothetical protein